MVSIAPNMGNRLTKATIDEAIESLKEEVGPVSESIIVVYMEAPTRTIGTNSAHQRGPTISDSCEAQYLQTWLSFTDGTDTTQQSGLSSFCLFF